MSCELIKKELSDNIGKWVLIFLKNGFRFEGRIIKVGDNAVKIYDKIKGDKVIVLSIIASVEKGKPGGTR